MKFLRLFGRHAGGASALEFAILTPIMAGLVVSGFDIWQLITRKQDMHAAINAGAYYYMAGGTDDPTAQSISMNGWPNRPSGSQITISRACTCAGGASGCSTLCAATQQAPEIRVTLKANSQWDGIYASPLAESETVRVR